MSFCFKKVFFASLDLVFLKTSFQLYIGQLFYGISFYNKQILNIKNVKFFTQLIDAIREREREEKKNVWT